MTAKNIRTFLDLSTAHLKPETREDLNNRDSDDLPFAGGPSPYGWFAYAHDENCGEGANRIPDEMFACMQYARSLGCEYILFDCDVEPIEELPTFEDEPTTSGADEEAPADDGKTRFLVTVDFQNSSGSDGARRIAVSAADEDEAAALASAIMKTKPYVMKVTGGTVERAMAEA